MDWVLQVSGTLIDGAAVGSMTYLVGSDFWREVSVRIQFSH
jgi:hypothetical protein